MSLKAKLEAVIYAAEEPVTLAQLALLFSAEALEWKAEQEAVSAKLADEATDQELEAAESVPLLNGEFNYTEADQAADSTTPEPAAEAAAETSPETAPEPAAEAVSEPDSVVAEGENATPDNADGVTPEPNPADVAAAEAEAKRLAKQQDREIKAILRQLLDELITAYAADGRGMEIREIAGGYRMATKPEYHDAVRMFVKSLKPPLKLSLPALETLAVVAYKQPVTVPEVSEIRGVDSAGVFGSLLARKLITTAGRKQVIGRPILYKTTKEFLLRFGLKNVSELPSMEEFEKMAASELDDSETAASDEQATETTPDLSPELDETDDNTTPDPADEPPATEENEPTTPEAAPAAPPQQE
jgi:segregation and condensation protein B